MESSLIPRNAWQQCRMPPVGVPFSAGGSYRHVSSTLVTVAMTRSVAEGVRDEGKINRLFVLGAGFVGRYVSDRFIKQGWHVSGTCTSAPRKRELQEMGLEAFLFDAISDKLRSLHALQEATHLLISIPPIVGIGDPLLSLHGDVQDTIRDGNLQWLGYLSSTSVYGDCGGVWVDEDYPTNPKTESAKSRLAAERGWLDLGHELGVAVNVFRLGGTYGPGRSALDTVIKGKSLSEGQKKRESKLFTSRVHVADIYQAIKASCEICLSRRIYNVVDDDPAPREEVFAFARSMISKKWPEMASKLANDDTQDEQSPESRGGEKRVSNARLKKELGVTLLYPTYRLGLQNIIDSWEQVPNLP
ncbi:hypothetical protein Cni_G12582 [Canna indica]|uniref:NAD-dependent epimerase/dehydratase domain-containing protein n=1 Tax=Canna indica TaxID=4628 RepID=A0AAQ3K835_9LILI|nr:hypothetical protein Cni_G12582 [Canna indica]